MRHNTFRAGVILLLCCIYLVSLCSEILYAEMLAKDDRKIELDKTEVIGVLERPSAIFPIHWRNPEGPVKDSYKLERSFSREIFEFIDMATINKMSIKMSIEIR